MMRSRRTIRGIDDDAWQLLVEVRESSRTQTGALVGEAIRFWYQWLGDQDELEDYPDVAGETQANAVGHLLPDQWCSGQEVVR